MTATGGPSSPDDGDPSISTNMVVLDLSRFERLIGCTYATYVDLRSGHARREGCRNEATHGTADRRGDGPRGLRGASSVEGRGTEPRDRVPARAPRPDLQSRRDERTQAEPALSGVRSRLVAGREPNPRHRLYSRTRAAHDGRSRRVQRHCWTSRQPRTSSSTAGCGRPTASDSCARASASRAIIQWTASTPCGRPTAGTSRA